jgi:hypothetical protein
MSVAYSESSTKSSQKRADAACLDAVERTRSIGGAIGRNDSVAT